MSKSLGNIVTLRDLVDQGFRPEAIRYLLSSVPYRNKLNFTFDSLRSASTAIERLRNFHWRLENEKFPDGVNQALHDRTAQSARRFEEALDDDLNTTEGLAAVFEFVREANTAMDTGEFRAGNTHPALDLLRRFDAVFDVLRPSETASGLSDAEIEALIAERNSARRAKNFARSDQIRNELLERGVVLEDTKDGTRWKRK
jgi:cysteinyl-tRNA synthetase